MTMPDITVRIVCSKGTDIRAIARDLERPSAAVRISVGLRRTRVGDFLWNHASRLMKL